MVHTALELALRPAFLTGPGGPFEGVTDLTIIGYDADPDSNGRANVFELWRGSAPNIPDTPVPPVLFRHHVGNDDFAAIELQVDPAVDNVLAISVMVSHDRPPKALGTPYSPGTEIVRSVLVEACRGQTAKAATKNSHDPPSSRNSVNCNCVMPSTIMPSRRTATTLPVKQTTTHSPARRCFGLTKPTRAAIAIPRNNAPGPARRKLTDSGAPEAVIPNFSMCSVGSAI